MLQSMGSQRFRHNWATEQQEMCTVNAQRLLSCSGFSMQILSKELYSKVVLRSNRWNFPSYFFLPLPLCCIPSCWVTTVSHHHSLLSLSPCPCYASAPGRTSSTSPAQILKMWLSPCLFHRDYHFSIFDGLVLLCLPQWHSSHIYFYTDMYLLSFPQ